jgi:fatty-acyl-CoA synthase/long-chain acyl-CoA synthetase
MASDRSPTLHGLFVPALDRFGPRPAVVAGGVTWTYADIVDHANRLAHVLGDAGVEPGEPVALAISNRAEWIIADQAIIRAGAAKVPINDMLSAPEIEYILGDSGAKVALVDSALMARVAGADAPGLAVLICVDGAPSADPRVIEWADALAAVPAGVAPPEVVVGPDDPTMILYTGGTTGRQKGVVHTQRTLASCEIAHLIELGLLDDERMLIISPLPHATGFLAQAGMLKGAALYIEPGFDVGVVLERIARDRITFVFMVPTMIYRVLDRAEGSGLDFSSLRTLLYGAAPMAVDKLARGLTLFGPVFMQLYGQSEAPDFITRLRREDHDLSQLRPGDGLHGDGRRRRPGPSAAGRPGRPGPGPRPLPDARLPQYARQERSDAGRRLAPYRRHRPHRRRRLPVPARPDERHDHQRRDERVLLRGGERCGGLPRRGPGGRGRPAR